MGWKRTNGCLMCGQDRCMENSNEPGVGYCFRFQTMHRHGKPFLKEGQESISKRKGQQRKVFGKGVEVGFGEGKGEKAVSEKGCPPFPPQESENEDQIKFDFE